MIEYNRAAACLASLRNDAFAEHIKTQTALLRYELYDNGGFVGWHTAAHTIDGTPDARAVLKYDKKWGRGAVNPRTALYYSPWQGKHRLSGDSVVSVYQKES